MEPYRNVGLPSYGGNAAVAGATYGGNGSYGPNLGAVYNAGYAGSDVPFGGVEGGVGVRIRMSG